MNLQALRWQNRRPNAATDRFVSGVGVIALIVMILAMAPELSLVLTGAMLLSGLIVGAYFAPLIVAICRGHRNELAIGVLNMLLGWTIIGWVAALVWACTANVGSASKAGWTQLDHVDPNPVPLRMHVEVQPK